MTWGTGAPGGGRSYTPSSAPPPPPPRPRSYAHPGVASDGLPVLPSYADITSWRITGRWQPPSRKLRTVLLTIAVVLFIAACGLTILLLIANATGAAGFVLGSCLATLPVPLLIWAFRWLDRYEPEPLPTLLFALAWGAAVATLAALFLNEAGTDVFFSSRPPDDLTGTAVFVAPPVEEFAKALGIVILAFRRRINSIVDGVVLAGLVGVGFAFTENILYLGRAYSEIAADAGTGTALIGVIAVFVMRGVASPLAHPFFTMASGIGIALAVLSPRRPVRILAPVAGYGVAMFLHGTWNYTATRGLGGFATAYVAIMVPVFALAVALALWFRRREGRVLARRLPVLAEAGWIAPHEVAVVSSLWLRRLFVDVARFAGGRPAQRATRDYHDVLTTLAFQRERIARGRDVTRTVRDQVAALATLPDLRARAYVPPPPPLVPLAPAGPAAGPPAGAWLPGGPWAQPSAHPSAPPPATRPHWHGGDERLAP